MDIETIREYCLSKKGVTESLPFGDDTLVFKVMGRIFVLMNLEGELSLNLKCDPGLAISLREQFPCVMPGYHMNKRHWNTILMDGSVPASLIRKWIDDSYQLTAQGLPQKLRKELAEEGRTSSE